MYLWAIFSQPLGVHILGYLSPALCTVYYAFFAVWRREGREKCGKKGDGKRKRRRIYDLLPPLLLSKSSYHSLVDFGEAATKKKYL